MRGRLASRLQGLLQVWRASDNPAGEAVWHGDGFVVSLHPGGWMEIVDAERDVIGHAMPGDPSEAAIAAGAASRRTQGGREPQAP